MADLDRCFDVTDKSAGIEKLILARYLGIAVLRSWLRIVREIEYIKTVEAL